jgi:hypothetical protein
VSAASDLQWGGNDGWVLYHHPNLPRTQELDSLIKDDRLTLLKLMHDFASNKEVEIIRCNRPVKNSDLYVTVHIKGRGTVLARLVEIVS